MGDQSQFDILDIISILSFMLGYENLIENRQQSRHNDVSAANERQAQYILLRLEEKFSEIENQMAALNEHLDEQDRKLSFLEVKT